MKLSYVVNRASVHPREVEVTYLGETAKAMVSELEVELVDPTNTHGTLTMRFSQKSDMESAQRFVAGAVVTVDVDSFDVMPPPEAASEEAVQEEATA